MKWMIAGSGSVITDVIPLKHVFYLNRNVCVTTPPSTLTSRVAAIQFKMLHIQYRVLKIAEDKERAVGAPPKNPRERVKATKNAAYSFIDTMICMEHVVGLVDDIFATEELRQPMEREIYTVLNASKKAAEKWKPVRNRLGGHLSIDTCIKLAKTKNWPQRTRMTSKALFEMQNNAV